jgi:hypothetical protein
MGALAIPPLLAFAAYGLDGLMKLSWPEASLGLRGLGRPINLNITLAALLIVPLGLALNAVYDFTRIFYTVDNMTWIYESYANANDGFKASGLQWVEMPLGEHFHIEPAINLGLKLTNVANTSTWEGRTFPQPRLIASRTPLADAQTTAYLEDIPIYDFPQQSYAYVESGDLRIPCMAAGQGGDLTVTCTTDQPGRLIVQENATPDWQVQRDGIGTAFSNNSWLTVEAPAGTHTYEFHYRPWDVLVGLILTLIGLALTAWLWIRAPDRRQPAKPSAPVESP